MLSPVTMAQCRPLEQKRGNSLSLRVIDPWSGPSHGIRTNQYTDGPGQVKANVGATEVIYVYERKMFTERDDFI